MSAPSLIVKSTIDSCAIASLILAILSLLLGHLISIPAIILGHISRGRIRKHAYLNGEGLAIAGLIIGYIFTIVTFVMISFW